MVEYRATQMLRDVYKLTKTFVYYLQAKFTHREAIYEERKIKAERERENKLTVSAVNEFPFKMEPFRVDPFFVESFISSKMNSDNREST